MMLTKMGVSPISMRSVLLSWVTLKMLWIELNLTLFLNRRFRGRGFLRASLLAPYALSTVTITFLWRWMLNDINGIVNFVLLSLGLVSSQILSMRGSVSAISTVIMMDVWQATPYTAILLHAGLQAIQANSTTHAEAMAATSFSSSTSDSGT